MPAAATAPPTLPRYGEASLADLTPSVLTALDVPGHANPLGIEPARRACVLLVDGLGWELLASARRYAPLLASLADRGLAIWAGFPATTAASLASLGTGLPPS